MQNYSIIQNLFPCYKRYKMYSRPLLKGFRRTLLYIDNVLVSRGLLYNLTAQPRNRFSFIF